MHSAALKIQDLETEQQIRFLKQTFSQALARELQLHPVFAPLFVPQDSGINDDLSGETPVTFRTAHDSRSYAIVHSLAKWKRLRLQELRLPPGQGIVTDMIALRPLEQPSPLHSVLVDQWDWELVMRPEQRHPDFLQSVVRRIYTCIRFTAQELNTRYPGLSPQLPGKIAFLHTADLQRQYPSLSPKEREDRVARQYGAVFLMGIGAPLADGQPHDARAADYDDWSSPSGGGYQGLNGDILLWHPILGRAFEISSMGIRVDALALLRQLALSGAGERQHLPFHQALLRGELPQTIGGGIGQSRLAMFLLQKEHIGAVQYCCA